MTTNPDNNVFLFVPNLIGKFLIVYSSFQFHSLDFTTDVNLECEDDCGSLCHCVIVSLLI